MIPTSDEKLRPFNCFFSRVGLRTYQHLCIINVVIPVWKARRSKNLTASSNKKAPTFADIEEQCLNTWWRSQAERRSWKANKRKALSLFNAELCQEAENEVQKVRELNTEHAWIIREQTTRRRAELRTEWHRKKASKLDKLVQYT